MTTDGILRDLPDSRWMMGAVHGWARRGSRPRQPADQRYENAYLFGAICPARGTGAALALRQPDTEAMQLHLNEISHHVAEGAHAVLLMDRAGWHTTAGLDMPSNITPILLPSRAPELNPVENIWQYMRAWLSNRVFENYDASIEAACEAWPFSDDPSRKRYCTSLAGGSWSRVPPDGRAMPTLLRLPIEPVSRLPDGLRWRSAHTPFFDWTTRRVVRVAASAPPTSPSVLEGFAGADISSLGASNAK